MTVIIAQLNLHSVIHATDSLLTRRNSRRLAKGTGTAKVLAVPQFRGGISWWGQVSAGTHWNAKQWLQDRIALLDNAPGTSSDEFASNLAGEMTVCLRHSHSDKGKGLGLHFSTFDEVDGILIPELFLITNYTGLEYGGGEKFVSHRQTFHWLSGNADINFEAHKEKSYRVKVANHLKEKPIIFSNGQPSIFGAHVPHIENDINTVPSSNVGYWDSYPIKLCNSIVETHKRYRGKRKALVGTPCFCLRITPDGNSELYEG